MTNREFFVAVAANEINEDVIAHALAAIEKMDATAKKRRNTPSKAATANAKFHAPIMEMMNTTPEWKFTAAEIASQFTVVNDEGEEVPMSTPRATAILRELVKQGQLQSDKEKFPKVGERIVYFIA